jgi:hypothetical protein
MKRALALALALCAGLGWLIPAAPAQAAKAKQAAVRKATPAPAKITGAKVLEFGVYAAADTRDKPPAMAGAARDSAREFRLVRKSTLVDARLGTGIGLLYELKGSPQGAAVNIEVAWSHPAGANLSAGQSTTYSTASVGRVIGQAGQALWTFDTPEGLVPGEYVLEILSEGKPLARKAFLVKVRR